MDKFVTKSLCTRKAKRGYACSCVIYRLFSSAQRRCAYLSTHALKALSVPTLANIFTAAFAAHQHHVLLHSFNQRFASGRQRAIARTAPVATGGANCAGRWRWCLRAMPVRVSNANFTTRCLTIFVMLCIRIVVQAAGIPASIAFCWLQHAAAAAPYRCALPRRLELPLAPCTARIAEIHAFRSRLAIPARRVLCIVLCLAGARTRKPGCGPMPRHASMR